jgi:hypothetical protein
VAKTVGPFALPVDGWSWYGPDHGSMTSQYSFYLISPSMLVSPGWGESREAFSFCQCRYCTTVATGRQRSRAGAGGEAFFSQNQGQPLHAR